MLHSMQAGLSYAVHDLVVGEDDGDLLMYANELINVLGSDLISLGQSTLKLINLSFCVHLDTSKTIDFHRLAI